MRKESGRTRGGVKIFGRIFSDAFQQARQIEIDVLAKRGVRDRYRADGGSSAQHRDEGSPDEIPPTRENGRLRTILRCCSEANRQATQSEIDVLARRRYRVLHGVGGPDAHVPATGEQTDNEGERTAHDEKRVYSIPGPVRLEGSLPDGL